MSVTEVVGGLGSWRLVLVPETPQHVRDALGFFGHVAIVDGPVDVEATGDAILAGARYVGVIRELPEPDDSGQEVGGSGMAFWLGDEDGKGYVLEGELDLSGKTLAQAVGLVLDPVHSVTVGTVHPKAGTMPAGSVYVFMSPRQVLQDVCDAFGVEYRVNGDGSVDVGTQAQLYQGTPEAVVWRFGSGSDPDLIALSGVFDVDATVYDWTTRVLMVGSRRVGEGEATTEERFITAAADMSGNPYLDLFGNPVVSTRIVSDSSVNEEGTAQSRAQLNLNRFGRVLRSFTLTSADYDTEGTFRVGDMLFVYDPDTGIVDPAVERTVAGRVIHPDTIRLTEATWTIKPGYTVAYRDQTGKWYDLTPFVTDEREGGRGDQLVVGDLPRSLSRPSGDPLQDRIDSTRPDTGVPSAPTGLVLSTDAYVAASGATLAFITAEWVKPTTNTDGTAYNDHSHFLIQSRWTGRGYTEGALRTSELNVDITGLAPALPHEVRVAAVDTGGKVGEWATAVIVTAEDDIAPSTPAAGTLSSFLGQLRLDWPGVDADGLRMSDDTKTVNVHIGTPGFTVAPDNRIDALSPFSPGVGIYDWPLGVDVEVKLQAEDHTGNLSQPSEGVVGETAPLGDNEIGSLSVGRLTGGILDAVVIVGQRIVSGGLTGQRTQMEPSGWRAFDANEDQTVNIDGLNNWMVGRFQAGREGERRIIIDSSYDAEHDTTGGGISFYAPDATSPSSTIRSFTTGGGEAISMSVPIGSGVAYASWNSIQVNDNPGIYLVSRHLDFIFGVGGTAGNGVFLIESTSSATISNPANRKSRYQVDAVNHVWWPATGPNTRGQMVLATAGSNLDVSPLLTLANRHNFGASLRYYSTSTGADAQLGVVAPNDASYHPIAASEFRLASDEALKEKIKPVSVLDELRSSDLQVVEFDWKDKGERRKKSGPPRAGKRRRQRGMLAGQVPKAMRAVGPDGVEFIDLSAGLATALGSIKELAAIVDEIARRTEGDTK